jgi:hypothetical protein
MSATPEKGKGKAAEKGVSQTSEHQLIAAALFAPVGGCTTIDQSTNDNGFLGCARAGDPGAGQHGSTAQAVSNLLACLGAGVGLANIIGHGNDGLIVTGQGQEPTDPDKYIFLYNQYAWEPYLRQLRGHVNSLKLWACHPGTGDMGADFLYAIAKVINALATGPTGFLYCSGGNMSLEAGSTWQVATPTNRPNPIPAPTPHFSDLTTHLILSNKPRPQRVSLDDLIFVEYIPRGIVQTTARNITFEGNDGKGLLRLARFDSPFEPGGVPAAIVTGRLIITFAVKRKGRKAEEQREFLIYNNRLLQDKLSPETFYNATTAFTQTLAAL